MRQAILTLLLLCHGGVQYLYAQPTAKSIEAALEVNASPLQCFRALTAPWQLRYWLGALEVSVIAEPGGPWRVKHTDGTMEEGLCLTSVPGERFDYTIIAEATDTVQIELLWRQDGTGIRIRHRWAQDSQDPDRSAEMDRYWSRRIDLLAEYLNTTPGCYLAFPVGNGPFPAVVLLHDRLGINRMIRALADSLAAGGYVAVAIDMFKGEVTADLNQADRYLQLVDDSASVQTVLKIIESVRQRGDVKRNRIAVWGVGYGGSIAFTIAATDPKLRACVSWYGSKLPDASLQKRIATPVLAIFGDHDILHPRSEIEAFDQSLVSAGVRVESVILAGGHSFADPAFGEEYNELTAHDALLRTLLFLDKRLKL